MRGKMRLVRPTEDQALNKAENSINKAKDQVALVSPFTTALGERERIVNPCLSISTIQR